MNVRVYYSTTLLLPKAGPQYIVVPEYMRPAAEHVLHDIRRGLLSSDQLHRKIKVRWLFLKRMEKHGIRE